MKRVQDYGEWEATMDRHSYCLITKGSCKRSWWVRYDVHCSAEWIFFSASELFLRDPIAR